MVRRSIQPSEELSPFNGEFPIVLPMLNKIFTNVAMSIDGNGLRMSGFIANSLVGI